MTTIVRRRQCCYSCFSESSRDRVGRLGAKTCARQARLRQMRQHYAHGPRQCGGKVPGRACPGDQRERRARAGLELQGDQGRCWRWDGDLLVNGGGKCLQSSAAHHERQRRRRPRLGVQLEATNQKWRMENGAIISNASGLCLDVNRPDMNRDGGRVQLWTCVPGQPPQVWQFEEFQGAR